MQFYFLRHGESLKSVEDRHGGLGMPLTAQGRSDAVAMATFLADVERPDKAATDFVCSPLVQVRETAEIIGKSIDVRFREAPAVRNIFLGVLDGLSREEAMRMYPLCAQELNEWRRGERSIEDVHIPGAETMDAFYQRIFGFLVECREKSRDVVLVGTRSVGVAVSNILTSGSPVLIGENYQRYLFDPGSASKFIWNEGEASAAYLNRTSFLAVRPNNPDE